jgi:transcriptional regulator with XRE-family HTH domain
MGDGHGRIKLRESLAHKCSGKDRNCNDLSRQTGGKAMDKLNQHWTSRSTADFAYRITSDFVAQLEMKIEQNPIERQELAGRLGVSPGRVSQVLNKPGNLTVAKIVQYARALGMKVAIIAYDDGDHDNNTGPISAEVFARCWSSAGKPRDLFYLSDIVQFASYSVHIETQESFYRPRHKRKHPPITGKIVNQPQFEISPTAQIQEMSHHAN